MNAIFQSYSQYTGTGILMVLFFTGLIVIALKEKDCSTRTLVLYGSISVVALIFFPPFYFLYSKYIEDQTYWRMWWIIPTGIGSAYVGTQIIQRHRWTGLILVLVILMLGGEWVYSGSVSPVERNTNAYKLPQDVIDIVDFLDEYEDNEYIYAAFPPELLPYVRQYNTNVQMPYGHDSMYFLNGSEFYLLMAEDATNFAALEEHCLTELTRYIILKHGKEYQNDPADYNFELLGTFGQYDVYGYTGRDWKAWFDRINSTY